MQVGRAVLVGRGADGDELHFGVLDRFFDVGGEAQPAFGDVAGDDGFEARLPDGDDAGLELVDLALVNVDADDAVADFGHARPGDQPRNRCRKCSV